MSTTSSLKEVEEEGHRVVKDPGLHCPVRDMKWVTLMLYFMFQTVAVLLMCNDNIIAGIYEKNKSMGKNYKITLPCKGHGIDDSAVSS